MKTVAQYATETSGQLNDQFVGREFTRWTRAQLISYLNAALAEIACYRPDAFASYTDITLVPGAKQQLADANSTLMSISVNSPDGAGVTQADYELLKVFSSYTCCASNVVLDTQGNPTYTVKSYAIDPKAPATFYVDPPVPEGMENVKVSAQLYGDPPVYSLEKWEVNVAIALKYSAAILDYMMARGFDIDSESPLSRANANSHFQRFYNALGVQYRVESAHRAGNWNGAVGTGDPRARI